jgi:tripartite-type tricarboxylate transporter receptor subunit TctC
MSEQNIAASLKAAARPQIKAGKLRALAAASPLRSGFLPDVPGLDRLCLPAANFEVYYEAPL